MTLVRSPENTELVRTFELLQDLTQTRTPEEVLHGIRLQMDRYVYLQSANRRLDHLLHMVIQPEERMFADEYGWQHNDDHNAAGGTGYNAHKNSRRL